MNGPNKFIIVVFGVFAVFLLIGVLSGPSEPAAPSDPNVVPDGKIHKAGDPLGPTHAIRKTDDAITYDVKYHEECYSCGAPDPTDIGTPEVYKDSYQIFVECEECGASYFVYAPDYLTKGV